MKFSEKKLKDQGQGVYSVVVDGKEYTDALEKAKANAAKNIEVPGFRKGKAPKSEIEKRLTPSVIYDQVFRDLLNPAYKFAMTNKDAKLEPLNAPTPSIQFADAKSMTIDFTFDLKPDIKLGVYKGIKIDKVKPEVTDKEVDEVLENYRQRFAMQSKKPEGSKIEKGDVVKFDFKGFTDGKPFKGGEAKDYSLEIGSNQFVPGFEDAMIGLTTGDGQSIKVKFPTEYAAELAGKDAEFKLNIKEIMKKELPALDDELAKDMNMPNINTLADLKKKTKQDILDQKTSQGKEYFVDKVIKEVINNSTIDLPRRAVDSEIRSLKQDFEKQVAAQGLTMKDYKKATGMKDADLDKELEQDAVLRLQSYLVTSAIRDAEKFEVTDKDIDAKLEEYSKQFGVPADKLKKMLPMDQLKQELLTDKLVDFLYENNGK